jgi:dTDP-4-dehydrorhamnose reductase
VSKILIVGAGGQLGQDLIARYQREQQHDVVALTRAELDVSSREQVLGVIGAVKPDVVINAAAYTAVDKAEADVDGAYAVNAMGARNLAEASMRIDAHLVHVSTDYVFDGTKHSPYHEWDETSPQSVYGASKAAGEAEVRSIAPLASIVRTAWVCGPHGSNMLKTVVRLVTQSDGPLAFVNDQIGCPTFTDDLADAVYRVGIARVPGVLHATNTGTDHDVSGVSWWEFARAIASSVGGDPDRIGAITTTQLDPPRPAKRPANSVLAPSAWRAAGLADLKAWPEALASNLTRLTHTN